MRVNAEQFRMVRRRAVVAFALACALTPLAGEGAHAQSLEQALARAYASNPTLNAQRAQVRAIDEQVPQALSGYRPTISASADYGVTVADVKEKGSGSGSGGAIGQPTGGVMNGTTRAYNYSLSAQQNLFQGFQTKNRVRVAESNVLAGRENLRNSEQNVLFDAAQAYMDVLRDRGVLDVRRNNVEVLKEELRAARARLQAGEVTRTDIAQAEAAVAGARTAVSQAEAQLNTSRATYRQIVGGEIERPRPARGVDRLLPKNLGHAIGLSQAQHPAILAAFHGVDASTLEIRVFEGALLPVVGLEASFQQGWTERKNEKQVTTQATVVGRLTVPIYQGGLEYSQVRQAKQTAGQRRLEADTARDQVRQAVVSAWGTVQATTAQISSAQAQIRANQEALKGVREEAKVGQRTTLDVLNAQQAVLDARVSLIIAQHDRVVGAYALLSSIGDLTAAKLGLEVASYDPGVHFDQVRDKWIGLRTPDGR